MSFLIVDDDPIFLTLTEGILASLTSGRILSANSASAGLEMLSNSAHDIDCVFLDLNMPDLDGLSFLRRASYMGYKGRVVISSGEEEAVLRSAQSMGTMMGINIVGAIRKPLQMDEVAGILTKMALQPTPVRTDVQPVLDVLGNDYDLTPYYQPQVAIDSLQIIGLEALIRIITSDGHVHGPAKLFASIRDTQQSVDISTQVTRSVLDDVSKWRARGMDQTVAINFDAVVLEEPGFVAMFNDAVRQRNIKPSSICVEVTERALPSDLASFVEKMTRLRIAGFRLSLDDFGTGGSNFELLRICPFTEIKLDRSIIEAAPKDGLSRRFMQSAIDMADELGIHLVAEGVETHEELEIVRSAGIRIVQGFLFSRPVPAASVPRLVSDGPRRRQAS